MAIPWNGIVSRPIDELVRGARAEPGRSVPRETPFSERMIALQAAQGVRPRYGLHLAWEHRGVVDRLLG